MQTTLEVFQPEGVKRPIRKATRADLVRIVNLFLLRRSQKDYFPRTLLSNRHWQKAVWIARQNKLVAPDVIKDIAKTGVAIR